MLMAIITAVFPIYDKGDTLNAIKDFSKAIELDPDYVDGYNNRGNVYLESGQVALALKGL